MSTSSLVPNMFAWSSFSYPTLSKVCQQPAITREHSLHQASRQKLKDQHKEHSEEVGILRGALRNLLPTQKGWNPRLGRAVKAGTLHVVTGKFSEVGWRSVCRKG